MDLWMFVLDTTLTCRDVKPQLLSFFSFKVFATDLLAFNLPQPFLVVARSVRLISLRPRPPLRLVAQRPCEDSTCRCGQLEIPLVMWCENQSVGGWASTFYILLARQEFRWEKPEVLLPIGKIHGQFRISQIMSYPSTGVRPPRKDVVCWWHSHLVRDHWSLMNYIRTA